MADDNATKRCGHCREVKPADAFYLRKTGRYAGRLHSWCKECGAAEARERYLRRTPAQGERRKELALARYHANRDEILARRRAQSKTPESRAKNAARHRRWLENNRARARELVRESVARRSKERRAEVVAYLRVWREQNPVRGAELMRAWAAENPEAMREYRRRRRARHRAAYVERVEALVVLEMADGVCGICGTDVDAAKFEIDHIVPLSKGGLHSYANCQPAHPRCNRVKADRMPDDLVA